MPGALLLAHDRFDPLWGKTAVCILRYNPGRAVAVVDRSNAGRDAGEVVGPVGRGVPVVASVEEGLRFGPDEVVIGIAPVGGALPDAWRPDLRAALDNGLGVVSGLHTFLADDPELSALAQKSGASIVDVRRPPAEKRILDGSGRRVRAPVVLTVGTDCSSGKMTTAVEIVRAARARGLRAAFAATGQTGIMIGADAGVAVDAVVSDFVAGATERLVLECARSDPDLIVVEGQGTLTHPAYAGVTASLLFGACPDLLVLCHDARRKEMKGFGAKLRSPREEIALNETLLSGWTRGKACAVSLMTLGLSERAAKDAVARVRRQTRLPTTDPVRSGPKPLLDAVLARAGKIPGKRALRRLKR
ncbi:MAG TPA: DUF1611 domain-containing protein [Candidatus Thermoplasmatota archaeon]|nr:DUF1611 domain-containing protein [Candidatus Thermoplasmatota archaeon]